jgi:hypothetical protein
VAFGYVAVGPLLAWLGPRALYLAGGFGAVVATVLLLPLWRLERSGDRMDPGAAEPEPHPRFTSAEELERAPVGAEAAGVRPS